MENSFSVNIIGVPELIKLMKDKQNEMSTKLPDTLRDVTLFLHGQIKDSIAHGTNAPVTVDTGRFLNSVDFDMVGPNTSRIFSELEYAKFLEFGTNRMAPRPHFQNTLFVNEENIKKVFEDSLSVIFK